MLKENDLSRSVNTVLLPGCDISHQILQQIGLFKIMSGSKQKMPRLDIICYLYFGWNVFFFHKFMQYIHYLGNQDNAQDIQVAINNHSPVSQGMATKDLFWGSKYGKKMSKTEIFSREMDYFIRGIKE